MITLNYIYNMNKKIEHALIVLEKQEDWMSKDDLANEVRRVFPKTELRDVHKYLYSRANIGYDSQLGFRYYEPNELTNKVQVCIDRGEDW